MNVDSFGGSFTAFNFGLGKATSILKTQNPNIVSDGNPNVMWHSMKTLLNFMRHLTSINILCLTP